MKLKRAKPLTLCAIAVVAAALVDCGPICHDGQQKCEGNTFMWCDTSPDFGGPIWDSQACPVACNSQTAAGCVDSPQPIPQCSQDGPACWGNSTTSCQHGYPTGTTPCISGMTCNDVSFSGGSCAFCANGTPTPDARCLGGSAKFAFCAGSTAYQCECGEIYDSTACAAPTPNCVVTTTGASCVQ